MKKVYRVKKSHEFDQIIKHKKFYSSPTLVLYIKKREFEHSRVGISVGKKLGNAVKRNKVKRQIRMMIQEIFSFNEDFDTIIIVREKYKEETYQMNRKNLEKLYKKVTIVK